MTPHESYHDRIRDSKNPRAIRPAMVEFYPGPVIPRPCLVRDRACQDGLGKIEEPRREPLSYRLDTKERMSSSQREEK